MSCTEEIKSKAIELGFDIVGITNAEQIDSEQIENFESWFESGFAGQMSYMQNNFEKRTNPSKLLENAQSVIIVGLNYNPAEKVSPNRTQETGKIVSYACYEDYHTFIKKRLQKLVDYIVKLNEQNKNWIPACAGMTESGMQNGDRVTSDKKGRATSKICVDSVPLAERALAVRAGLGFIGKNHMLINPEMGCKIFLGEIITDLKLEYDKSLINSETICSTCEKCIKVCPTGALRQDGFLDASKCINYLTIEYKGEIPTELGPKIGNRLFGCEECINVCPYQAKAPACKNKEFKFHSERMRVNLDEVLNMNVDSFNAIFADSAIHRTGLETLKRNARVCLSNRTSS